MCIFTVLEMAIYVIFVNSLIVMKGYGVTFWFTYNLE